jgi:endonuclease YncB( thermonuclease family)
VPANATADAIAGTVGRVPSTDTLYVDGRRIQLAGVEGLGEPHASALGHYLRAGRTVNCVPSGERYSCITSDRVDVARLVLRNGAGRASPDASPQYRQDEERARRDGKGIWHNAP